MTTGKLNRFWTLIIVLLAVIIIAGSIVAWARYPRSQPIDIVISPVEELTGEIYIGGAITNAGLYPLRDGDRIEDIIQAAGGTTNNADLTRLEIYVPQMREGQMPQKIDINRAEAWLLPALPGIGDTRAQAIIEYRKQNGLFHNTYELTRVEGIGTTTYENTKHLITVAD